MMPEKPRPKAAATVNSPTSFWVSRNDVMAAACQADPISTVASPPMRSEIAPQICRLRNAVPSSTDSISAPTERAMPRSLQKATRWPCGIAIGMQHSTAAPHISANTALGGQRDDDADLESWLPQHGLPPAGIGDHALEHRRPQRAGEIAAARDQRQRRTAPAVEPAADINVHWRIDAAEPDQADEQPVPDPQRPGRAEG